MVLAFLLLLFSPFLLTIRNVRGDGQIADCASVSYLLAGDASTWYGRVGASPPTRTARPRRGSRAGTEKEKEGAGGLLCLTPDSRGIVGTSVRSTKRPTVVTRNQCCVSFVRAPAGQSRLEKRVVFSGCEEPCVGEAPSLHGRPVLSLSLPLSPSTHSNAAHRTAPTHRRRTERRPCPETGPQRNSTAKPRHAARTREMRFVRPPRKARRGSATPPPSAGKAFHPQPPATAWPWP